jgi:CBS domain-containing protein
VEFVDGTQVADVLYEGEVFGFVSLLTALATAFTVRAQEETICYLVDQEIARELLSTRRGLSFLATGLRRREDSALRGLERETADPWRTNVGTLVRRPPVTTPVSCSVREAAELMTHEHVTSLLVQRANGTGLVTDKDLRALDDALVTALLFLVTATRLTAGGKGTVRTLWGQGLCRRRCYDARGSPCDTGGSGTAA